MEIAMQEHPVHQWRDWLLRYMGEGKYELIRKSDNSSQIITAKNHIEAENKSRVIINEVKMEMMRPSQEESVSQSP